MKRRSRKGRQDCNGRKTPVRCAAGQVMCAAAAAVIMAQAGNFPSLADEWDRSEDGKYWMYFDYSGEPVTDEWIEDKGKIYYLDSKGYMKTGWVTNRDDGNKYYMGEDGAMVTNAFTPDDKYVGPDGTVVEAYDTYRKKVKAEIKKAARKSGTGRTSRNSRNKSGSQAGQKQSYFLLTDLNRDGYRDLVVMEREAAEDAQGADAAADQAGLQAGQVTGGNLVEIAVWDPEDQEFLLSAEFDEAAEGEKGVKSILYQNLQGQGIWLELQEDEENFRLFRMEIDTAQFECIWSFSTRLDDWGGLEYLLDRDVVEKEVWDFSITEAKRERGTAPLAGYLPVTDEWIAEQTDRELTEEDLRMWQ